MNNYLKKTSRKTLLLVLVAVFAIPLSVQLLNKHCPKSAAAENKPENAEKHQSHGKVVLHSALAGSWYPADAESLRNQISSLFEKANVKPIKNVIVLILPHAGYRYSGQTAATGLKTIDKQYKRIVIIGPSHRVPMEEVLSVPKVTHYQTPLGLVVLDVQFIKKLLEYPVFQNVPLAHKYEHSVQIELPLLQHCQRNFTLVPIVAGSCSLQTIKKAAKILKSLVDDQTLVIASSDFVHYGPNYGYIPFKENVPEQIKKLDMGAYDHIAKLDAQGFLEYRQKTGATICGYVPIAVVLSMLDKETSVRLVKYATSGQIMGDYSNSVSYLAVALSGKWENRTKLSPNENTSQLTDKDKETLLKLARNSLLYFLKQHRVPTASDLGLKLNDRLKQPRAAFVTLKKNSQLRGCIGDIFPRQPLYKSVIANAINAGVNDWRFTGVTQAECYDIKIEISALTVPKPVASPNDIRIGTDGVVLKKDGYSAVFLPQVAPEQGWDLEQTLTHLSLKAGLPGDAWKSGAEFLVFQAVVFGEEK